MKQGPVQLLPGPSLISKFGPSHLNLVPYQPFSQILGGWEREGGHYRAGFIAHFFIVFFLSFYFLLLF